MEEKKKREKKIKKRKEKAKREKGKSFSWFFLSTGGEERKESGVRNSTLSLRSTKIGPSVFVGARGKVHLRDESFA